MAESPPAAVLDASVLVPRWSRIVLQRLAAQPRSLFRPVWSEWVIAETWRVLTRRRVQEAAAAGQALDWANLDREANLMLRHFLQVMTVVSLAEQIPLPPAWPELTDEDDAPIWATARIAGAAFVVSHNTRHFPPLVDGTHAYQGVEYLTAIEFIEDVLGVDAVAVYGALLPVSGLVRSGRRSHGQR